MSPYPHRKQVTVINTEILLNVNEMVLEYSSLRDEERLPTWVIEKQNKKADQDVSQFVEESSSLVYCLYNELSSLFSL